MEILRAGDAGGLVPVSWNPQTTGLGDSVFRDGDRLLLMIDERSREAGRLEQDERARGAVASASATGQRTIALLTDRGLLLVGDDGAPRFIAALPAAITAQPSTVIALPSPDRVILMGPSTAGFGEAEIVCEATRDGATCRELPALMDAAVDDDPVRREVAALPPATLAFVLAARR